MAEARPRIEIRFTAEGLGTGAFSPLDLPGSFDVDLAGLDPDILEHVQADFTLQMSPGRYPVPLTQERLLLPLEVEEGCTATGRLVAERRLEGDQHRTIVAEAHAEFDPPLFLGNIVPVLAQLNTLFQDRQVSRFVAAQRLLPGPVEPERKRSRLRSAVSRRMRPRLDKWLPPGSVERRALHEARMALQASTEVLADVLLTRIDARPVLRGGIWQLDLRFSGRFEVLGRAPVPFRDILLPRVIIPSPHASLSRLGSGEPLASAVLHRDRLPIQEMLQVIVRTLAGFEATLSAQGEVPEVGGDLTLPGRGQVAFDLIPPGSFGLEGQVWGALDARRIEVRTQSLSLNLDEGTVPLAISARVDAVGELDTGESVAGLLAVSGLDGEAPSGRVEVGGHVEILEGAALDGIEVRLGYAHPLLLGGADLRTRLSALVAQGRAEVEGLRPDTGQGRANLVDICFSAGFEVAEDSRGDDGSVFVRSRHLQGSMGGHLKVDGPALVEVELLGSADFDLGATTWVDDLPELDVDGGELRVDLVGTARFKAQGDMHDKEDGSGLSELDFSGSEGEVVLHRVRVEQGDRALTVPEGSTLAGRVEDMLFDTSAWGRAGFDVRWDLQGQSPLLWRGERSAELFVPDLRLGHLQADLSEVGQLTLSGEEHGLYDARYFNALLNPDQELDRIQALLEDDEAIDKVAEAARVFTDEAGDTIDRARRFARRVGEAIEAEDLQTIADGIPGPVIARLLSRILVGTPELEPRLHPLVKGVTDGHGLDLLATKRILEEVLPENEWGFELDRGLRWLGQLLAPTEPIPPRRRRELPSLAEVPSYQILFKALPSADRLYRTLLDPAPLSPDFSWTVARLCSLLSLEQVEWILSLDRDDWRPQDLDRLRYVGALKRRVRQLSESYGGLAFTPQSVAIGMFLGATVSWSPPDEALPLPGEPSQLLPRPDCLLGPEDVAVLLQAGLAAPIQGRVVQRNQRLLLDLTLDQPPEFLRAVLHELSGGSPRVLTGVLMALLALEQGALREPLDLVQIFSERLDLQIPRLEDFLAGGRWARLSYWEALHTKAERILQEAEPWRALQAHLQRRRLPLSPGPSQDPVTLDLGREVREAIVRADELGALCTFKHHEPTRRGQAAHAYREAFEQCRLLVRRDPESFQLPWFRKFVHRNYEALMVLSVVRNVQEGVDRTREWLAHRLQARVPRSEQALVEAVVQVLYHDPSHRQQLLADPLVRLLLDPPEGHYDFTIVSAMGVVTDGSEGKELEDAFRRLEQRRGVKLVRSDTATARDLEFNARKIEEAVRQVQGPWGYVGYSQGCANGVWAETRLRSGTPEQAELCQGLVGRHLLFSAMNGSGHGTSGDLKFVRAMVEADHFLAHYQAVLSRQAIQLALRGFRMALDSRFFVQVMGGVESLAYEGVVSLGREVQIDATVPTTSLRGVVREEILPEALEFLCHALTVQVESDLHDTQVMMEEAVGYPVAVSNDQVRVMEACDVGALPQITHHWSPLLDTVDFITTERDRRTEVYQVPKDRHVFPWVELLARFGFIERS